MKQLVILKKNQKKLIYTKGTEKNRKFLTKKFNFILQSTEFGLITDKQLKSAFNIIKKKLKKLGHLIIHIFPTIGLTKKPVEVRMGKGKGSKISSYVYPIRPGKVIFELSGVNLKFANYLFKLALDKLPVKGKIVQI